jgi:hypothetical protein
VRTHFWPPFVLLAVSQLALLRFCVEESSSAALRTSVQMQGCYRKLQMVTCVKDIQISDGEFMNAKISLA